RRAGWSWGRGAYQRRFSAQSGDKGGPMKFLLTSGGIANPSIEQALVDLLCKPIAESSALCVATAMYSRSIGFGGAYRFIAGRGAHPMTELGWKSVGVLELTALPSIDREDWIAAVRATDA